LPTRPVTHRLSRPGRRPYRQIPIRSCPRLRPAPPVAGGRCRCFRSGHAPGAGEEAPGAGAAGDLAVRAV